MTLLFLAPLIFWLCGVALGAGLALGHRQMMLVGIAGTVLSLVVLALAVARL